MANQDGNDLSDMLNQLAEAQKAQEAELSELTGSLPPRRAVTSEDDDAAVEAMLSGASGEVAGLAIQEEPFVAPTAIAESAEVATPEDEHHMTNAAVEELYAAQHEGEEAPNDDMLAALAQEAGGDDVVQEPAASIAEVERDLAPSSRAGRTSSSASARGGKPKPVRKPDASIKAVFAPVLITFGLLMLMPAIWSVLILMGVKTWMHDGQGVDGMAKIMLICWPVSLGLLAGGIVAIVQVSREKAKQKQREQAMAQRH